MLLLPDVRGLGTVTLKKLRQGAAHSLGLLVLALLVHRQKAVEFHALVGGPEGMAGTPGVDGYRIIQGICHLGGQEPAPDQLIQPVLVLGQAPLNPLRVQLHMGGADGLVGILGTGFGFEGMEASIVVGSTIPAFDKAFRRSHSLVAEPQGVGTHIGDQTQGAFPFHIHAFIQLLGNGHGALGGHVQLPGSLLLQGRGGKRRRCGALLLRPLHTLHRKLLTGDVSNDGIHLCLVFQLDFLGIAVIPGSKGTGLLHQGQIHVQRPILLGLEGSDFVFPVHHQPGGYGLNSAGRQAPANLLPQQRGQLIAYDSIQNPPGLLGIHQGIVNPPGVLNGLADNILGNFVKSNPVGFLLRQLQKLLQVPGDGLSLPVRVGCQVDGFRLGGAFAQIRNHIRLILQGKVVGSKVPVNIHAHGALGQVPQVAHAGLHHIVRPQIFSNGFRLGRRLHNHKIG